MVASAASDSSMIYLLVERYLAWLEAHGWALFESSTFPPFRSPPRSCSALSCASCWGRPVIGWLRRQKIGDRPEFDQADLNKLMATKKGTPTMGGILIISSIAITTLLLANLQQLLCEARPALPALAGGRGGCR